jgi:tetratricopeptide (TPR) repeat protein
VRWLSLLDGRTAEFISLLETLWDDEGNSALLLAVLAQVPQTWYSQGRWSLAREWLDQATTFPDRPSTDLAKTLEWAGVLSWQYGDHDTAVERTLRAAAVAKSAGDRNGEASALTMVGLALQDGGNLEAARMRYRQAVEVFAANNNIWGVAWSRYHLGLSHEIAGDAQTAASEYERALAEFIEAGDGAAAARAYLGLGTLARTAGELERSRDLLLESLSRRRQTGDLSAIAGCTATLAAVELDLGHRERARELALEAQHVFARLGLQDRVARAQAIIDAADT